MYDLLIENIYPGIVTKAFNFINRSHFTPSPLCWAHVVDESPALGKMVWLVSSLFFTWASWGKWNVKYGVVVVAGV